MTKKQRLLSKRQNIFNKQLKKPVRTFSENKAFNKVIKKINVFCRHYKIGGMIKDRQLSFITKKETESKTEEIKPYVEYFEYSFSVKKNR